MGKGSVGIISRTGSGEKASGYAGVQAATGGAAQSGKRGRSRERRTGTAAAGRIRITETLAVLGASGPRGGKELAEQSDIPPASMFNYKSALEAAQDIIERQKNAGRKKYHHGAQ